MMLALRAILSRIPAQVWLALAAVLLVWLAYRFAYNRGVVSQQAETTAVQAKLDAALEANATNLSAIDRLVKANAELADGREADRKKAEKLAEGLAADRTRLEKALAAEKSRRGRIYARNPEAAAVGATVIPDSLIIGLRNDTHED
jgi:hypothetical protein